MSYYQNNRDNNRYHPYSQDDWRDHGGRGRRGDPYPHHGGRGRGGRGSRHFSNNVSRQHQRGGHNGNYGGGTRNERDGGGRYSDSRQRERDHHHRGPPGNDSEQSGYRSQEHSRPDPPIPNRNVDAGNRNHEGGPSDAQPTGTTNAVKDFLSMSYVEQLEAQIPISEKDKNGFKRKLPHEAIEPYSKDGCKRHSDEWKAHKEKVAAKVIERMKQSLAQEMANNAYDMDSDDSDEMNDIGLGGGGFQVANQTMLLEAFISALPTCHLMTVGFDYSGSGAEEMCFCPCHDTQMLNWRTLVSVSIGEGKCTGKANGRFKKPNHLIAHLQSMKNCPFHQYALMYLEELYDNWYPGLKHKGLYIENTRLYREVEAREKRLREEEFKRMRETVAKMLEREEREKKIQDAIETLNATNKDLAEKLKIRGELLEKLGVDPADLQSTRLPPKEVMVPAYEKSYRDLWVRLITRFEIDLCKSEEPDASSPESRTIRVEQDFSVQDFFDDLYERSYSEGKDEKGKNEFALILFKDLVDNGDVKRLLSRWTVQFEVPHSAKNLSKKEMEDMAAVDAGGPESQFFSYIFQRLSGLEVSGSKKSIKLFQAEDDGYRPTSDSQFNSRFYKEEDEGKEYEHITLKASLYYRAIGRLFAHCLSVGHKLPTEALPKLLRNAVIRGCMPTDPDYLDLDLADHLTLFMNEKSRMHLIKEAKTRKEFKEEVKDLYITENGIWMQSFRKGLFVEISGTGEECIPLSNLFRFVPLDVVDSLMFASSEYKADDLVKILVAKYSGDNDSLRKNQEQLFDEALPNILNTWQLTNRDMLRKFLSFTTGLSYLPIVPDFHISIMFEERAVEGSSSSDIRLPESHTCERSLSIPRTAYNGDFEVFYEKLTKAVENDYDKFTQN